MTASDLKPQTLRRACQACARGKRRCDQRWPRCTRCQTRGISCEYANVPLTTDNAIPAGKLATPAARNIPTPRRRMEVPAARAGGPPRPRPQLTIHHPLHLEIPKGYEPSIISFLVAGVSSLPMAFARDMKTHFIHPELWPCGANGTPPPPLRDIHALCQLFTRCQNTTTFLSLLRQKTLYHYRRISHTATATFSDTLASTQALLLAQCMLITTDPNTPYSEATSSMLLSLAQKLYAQAPVQLPSSLSPRRAWLFAESVRRTIIVAFMLRSVYSLQKRNYSVRTPFVDSLPFDIRTGLWDGNARAGADMVVDTGAAASTDAIVSLHQYSGMLESGLVHGISPFGGLILAACRGRAVEEIAYPAVAG
ncbi:Zn(II)2Cys6 transcription factor domain-containing protein [Aspergillus mulundensis]|uniref:Zn(2)-C6 fungal-type domain-containing protein n=1 Tax=Aspergillus mulundensis TaxID=1810919 RepID=A0A3D8RF66_9EURO|nr:Uncharacterized protein DSM5745_07849 [Aspergillus mulundensis]RDW72677.1 Uncharacterized protein DSM5745_07849 [Aspergillus mulundensis]